MIRPNDKPWFNGYLRRLRRKRDRLYKYSKADKSDYCKNKYTSCQTFYHNEIIRIKNEFETNKYDNLANRGKENPKSWWKLIKSVYKGIDLGGTIPALNIDDNVITNNKCKATAFNDYFSSISSLGNNILPTLRGLNCRVLSEGTLDSIFFTKQDVYDQILSLDASKSYGPDNLSPRFIKEGIESLATTSESF